MKISLGVFAVIQITGSIFSQPADAQSSPPGSYRTSYIDIPVEDRTLTAVSGLPTEGSRGHLPRISIGMSAISGMTMARLHAITGNQWCPTVRITGKNSWLRQTARGRLANAAFVAAHRCTIHSSPAG
jgi:hypothetical protein